MNNVNWFEIICGILELLICVYLVYMSSNLSYLFCVLGGFHLGKGFYEEK